MTESHTLAHWQASGQRQAETIREQDAEIARLRAEVARLTAPVADEAMVEKAAIAICRTSCVLPECSWCEGTGKLMQIKPGGWRAWRPNNEIDRGRWATPVWCPCCMGTGEASGG